MSPHPAQPWKSWRQAASGSAARPIRRRPRSGRGFGASSRVRLSMPPSSAGASHAPSSPGADSSCSSRAARVGSYSPSPTACPGSSWTAMATTSYVSSCRRVPKAGGRRSSSCSQSSARRAASTSGRRAGGGTRKGWRRDGACSPAPSRRARSRSLPATCGSSSTSRTVRRPALTSISSATASE